jgi:hypothetical protein
MQTNKRECSNCIHAVYDGNKVYCQFIGSYLEKDTECPKTTSTANDMAEFIDLPLVSGYKEACMEQVKEVVTKAEEFDEVEEVEEQQEKAVNKVVAKALFLSAQESAKSGKIGISILLYEGIDEATGQVRVASEQKVVKGQPYTQSPVITTWVDPKKMKEQGKSKEFTKMQSFLKKQGLTDVYAIISGNGEFRKIHKFLTEAEYESYMALVG